jgi:hypothetical protein
MFAAHPQKFTTESHYVTCALEQLKYARNLLGKYAAWSGNPKVMTKIRLLGQLLDTTTNSSGGVTACKTEVM